MLVNSLPLCNDLIADIVLFLGDGMSDMSHISLLLSVNTSNILIDYFILTFLLNGLFVETHQIYLIWEGRV